MRKVLGNPVVERKVRHVLDFQLEKDLHLEVVKVVLKEQQINVLVVVLNMVMGMNIK